MTETFLARKITLGGNRLPARQRIGVPEIDNASLLQSVAKRVFPWEPGAQKQFLVESLPLSGLVRILGAEMMLSARDFYMGTGSKDALVRVDAGISVTGSFTGASVIVSEQSMRVAEVLLEVGDVKDFVWDASLKAVYSPARTFVGSEAVYEDGVQLPLSSLIPTGTYVV